MPSSGFRPCASAEGPPPMPLASAYTVVALMNACPTSAPITTSNNHQDFEAASSRSSFSTSQRNTRGRSGEGKKHLCESAIAHAGVLTQLVQRSLADDASAAQQHQPITDARRVGEMMDREQQRAPRFDVCTEHTHRL